jgi:hypothetical protein
MMTARYVSAWSL